MENGQPAVRLEHVSKAFGDRKILDDVSFQVGAGEAFCLLGRSGTGKSVTLKLIIGLLKPDQGSIFIEGNKIQELDAAKLSEVRKRVGFLFQNAALFDSISVSDNVAFPLRRHTRKSEGDIQATVREKLEEVELGKDGEKMPSELSGGMRKRAGLARALSLDPGILLIDEPSSGLDRITAAEIYDLLLNLKKKQKVTLIVVTHDVRGARKFSDRFAVLDQGKIAGSGTAEELGQSENSLVRQLASGSET
ncbi:MAG TPA: ATP-binding cassette domain-containing protein [Bryobacteraceae bacterium]|nr:ATP-binding cassette domain-containing protein [Bryobacteraceae bacterium]